MAANTREIARAAVRAELGQVAFELFLREGFDKVTIDDLAAAAGVSRSTFLRYFGTKEDAVLSAFERPFLCAFSDKDPITAGNERHLLQRIKGTEGQPHTTIEGGGHFLQEDRGPQLAQVVIDLVRGS